MPKTLVCNFSVEYIPLPKSREAAWMLGMSIIVDMLKRAAANMQATEGEQATEPQSVEFKPDLETGEGNSNSHLTTFYDSH